MCDQLTSIHELPAHEMISVGHMSTHVDVVNEASARDTLDATCSFHATS